VVRLLQPWRKAGILAEGRGTQTDEGVPPGGRSRPVRANSSLHEACALWAHAWRKRHARGEVRIVRDADDRGLGFAHRAAAAPCQRELRARRATVDLTLHADNTRLREVGRCAARTRARRGPGTPASLDCLGCTHICGQAATDRLIVRRQTRPTRRRAKRQAITAELRRRLHDPVPQQGRWRRSVLLGHDWYEGVPLNRPALAAFRAQVMRRWTPALRRRSQKSRLPRTRRFRLERQWLPVPHLAHPVPWPRLHVTTEDRSPVRETRTLGSVRGVPSHRHPYRDR